MSWIRAMSSPMYFSMNLLMNFCMNLCH
jgi:hypothetical protein